MEDPYPLIRLRIREGTVALPHWIVVVWVGILLWGSTLRAAPVSTNEPATVAVSGFGFFGNRDMVRLLRNFQANGKMPSVLDSSFVEDAALILLSHATDKGYLHARLQADFKMFDGSQERFTWTNALQALLPGNFAALSAHFKLKGGIRFYYKSLEFEGLKAFSKKDAESYFLSTDTLLRLHRNRIFSPSGLSSSLAALRTAYVRAGYRGASVTTNQVHLNESSGAVIVQVVIHEGLQSIVRSVKVTVHDDETNKSKSPETLNPEKPYSQLWQQELVQKLQSDQFVRGYPDATVDFSVVRRETNAMNIQVDLLANVKTGRKITLGKVIFEGNKLTRTSVLKRQVKLEPGEPLNRVAVEESRQRLARLGVFDYVGLQYTNVNQAERDVIYDFKEAKPISLSVLAGYGSYEMLRGGLELEDRNVFGLAHNIRLRGIQSFKSSQGSLAYTVPEIFGKNVDLVLEGSGLRREEVSFTRKEYGGSVGIQRRLKAIQTDLTLRYNYQFLNAQNFPLSDTNLVGVTTANSASIDLGLVRDMRDNPLLPTSGLKLYTKIELASARLGGNVDYQRLVYGGSYNIHFHGGHLIHLNLLQGMTFTLGGTSQELPFNKRFFPGGENSVRGYQEGQASPLDANGNQLGAETYTQGNVEFEQMITKSWSVVAFFDAVGIARDRADYPWDQGLYSVGGGLNWRSLIGPVRLEYGYNLHRREFDPVGTLHFSIGFPF